MDSFIKKHIHYNFSKCLDKFAGQLLFKGITYYERILVFEHLQKFCQQVVLDIPIIQTELSFFNEQLVSVKYSFKPNLIESLKSNINKYLNKESVLNDYFLEHPSSCRLKYYWLDSDKIIGIGNFQSVDFLYIGLEQYNVHYIKTTANKGLA